MKSIGLLFDPQLHSKISGCCTNLVRPFSARHRRGVRSSSSTFLDQMKRNTSPNGETLPQAYRVLCTSGGKHLHGRLLAGETVAADEVIFKLNRSGIAHLAQRGMQRKKEKYSYFHIYCYFMDYNGTKFGPLTEAFVIRPYEGEVDVTSLETFPAKYLPQPVTTQGLIERGRKFIDFTAVTHLQYEGLTLGDSREEVCCF